MIEELGNYKKLIAGVLTAFSTWLVASYDDGFQTEEWVALAVAVIGIFVLWLVPAYNTPPPPPQPFSDPNAPVTTTSGYGTTTVTSEPTTYEEPAPTVPKHAERVSNRTHSPLQSSEEEPPSP